MSNAVKYLGELLSRQGSNLGDSYLIDQPEAAPLAAILEVKVSTTIFDVVAVLFVDCF